MTRKPVEAGERHARLMAIGFAYYKTRPNGSRRSVWFWRCDCGKEVELDVNTVRSGNTKSCGCLKHEVAVAMGKRLPVSVPRYTKDEAVARQVYAQIMSDARRRRREFSISMEQFAEIAAQKCHYCGAEPSMTRTTRGGTFTYNGMDRVDSSKGYTHDNVVPCCRTCNVAKNGMTVAEFLAWNKRVHEFNS